MSFAGMLAPGGVTKEGEDETSQDEKASKQRHLLPDV
jgi:hypothetical protein